jgi:hypothetical protein
MRNPVGISLIFLSLFFTSLAAAEEMPVPAESSEVTPVPAKLSEADEKKIIELRKKIEEKKTELNGSAWELTFNSSSNPKMKGAKDTFTFQNGQFKSAHYQKDGFTPTNYSVSIPSETQDIAVWETMLSGKEGIVFIRGEWEKDKMSGNITEQLKGGKEIFEHTFTTSARTSVSPTTTEEGQDVMAHDNSLASAMVSKETPQEAPPVTTPPTKSKSTNKY